VTTLGALRKHPLHLGSAFLALDEQLRVAVFALIEVTWI
jgi:hypothetical protein